MFPIGIARIICEWEGKAGAWGLTQMGGAVSIVAVNRLAFLGSVKHLIAGCAEGVQSRSFHTVLATARFVAMGAGRPVIAYEHGSVLDTVVPGLTRQFFAEQISETLMKVLACFDPAAFEPLAIRAYVQRFDNIMFRVRSAAFMDDRLAERGAARVGSV